MAGGAAAAGSGPVGAVLGAAAGITVDVAMAKGLELARRLLGLGLGLGLG